MAGGGVWSIAIRATPDTDHTSPLGTDVSAPRITLVTFVSPGFITSPPLLSMRRFSLLLSLPLALSLGACNVFEGASSDAVSSDATVLVSDGETALAQGNTAAAVKNFEKAVTASSPTTTEGRAARIGLAAAVTQQAGVSVMTLDRLASSLDALANAPGKGGPAGQVGLPALRLSASGSSVCSFAPPETAVRTVNLNEVDGYQIISQNVEVLRRAKALVEEALGLPANATRAQIEAAVARIEASGSPTNTIASALVVGAISSIGVAYDRVVDAGANDIEWVVVSPGNGGSNYFGYCAPSQAVVESVKQETACAVPDLRRAVDQLEIRAQNFGDNALARDIAETAREAYTSLEKELGGTCTG